MLRTIIIDDELIGINALRLLIEKHTEGIKVVATATDPELALEMIDNYRPEVVFLDINMPKMNGFELLDKLRYRDFKLVFTTAHNEFGIKAVKNKAQDYLLKPIDITELQNCVKNIISESAEKTASRQQSSVPLIEISVRDGIIFIRPEEIIRLEASGSYTVFYLDGGVKQMASRNLKEYEALLDDGCFYRCHQSHIINLKKVTKMVNSDGLFAKMNDGSMPEVGRKNKETLLEKLKRV